MDTGADLSGWTWNARKTGSHAVARETGEPLGVRVLPPDRAIALDENRTPVRADEPFQMWPDRSRTLTLEQNDLIIG